MPTQRIVAGPGATAAQIAANPAGSLVDSVPGGLWMVSMIPLASGDDLEIVWVGRGKDISSRLVQRTGCILERLDVVKASTETVEFFDGSSPQVFGKIAEAPAGAGLTAVTIPVGQYLISAPGEPLSTRASLHIVPNNASGGTTGYEIALREDL